MALKYPAYPVGEYVDLDSSLSVVDWVIEEARLVSELKKTEAAINVSTHPVDDAHIVGVVKQSLGLEAPMPPAAQRKIALRKTLDELKRIYKQSLPLNLNPAWHNATAALKQAYSRFDSVALDADMKTAAVADGAYEKELKKLTDLKDKRAELEAGLKNHRLKIADVYKNKTLPLSFRYDGVGEIVKETPVRPDGKQRVTKEMAERCAREREANLIRLGCEKARAFVKDWQSRARLFGIPVTVEGTAIHSLQQPFKKIWAKAYARLELHNVDKNPRFHPTDACTRSTVTELAAWSSLSPKKYLELCAR